MIEQGKEKKNEAGQENGRWVEKKSKSRRRGDKRRKGTLRYSCASSGEAISQ